MTHESGQRYGRTLLADISNAMVQAMREHYGKGPTKAKSYMVDNYIFIVMQDGLTTVEKTLLNAGEEHLVRQVRQRFQTEMAAQFSKQIESLIGRKVLGYQSQVVFDPDTLVEFFILEPGGGEAEIEATAEGQTDGGAKVGEATGEPTGDA